MESFPPLPEQGQEGSAAEWRRRLGVRTYRIIKPWKWRKLETITNSHPPPFSNGEHNETERRRRTRKKLYSCPWVVHLERRHCLKWQRANLLLTNRYYNEKEELGEMGEYMCGRIMRIERRCTNKRQTNAKSLGDDVERALKRRKERRVMKISVLWIFHYASRGFIGERQDKRKKKEKS